MITGERVMAVGFGLFGLVWVVQSRKLAYWSDFAPGSGFLPFWLGIVIVALSAVLLVQSIRAPGGRMRAGPEPERGGRVAAIAIGLFVCIGAVIHLGFVVAIAAYLGFLLGVVERRPLGETVLVALGTALTLWLLFKVWLKVPLPAGPWGF